MLKKHTCNMSNKESYIRVFLATLMMLLAFLYHSYILAGISIAVFYTAYKKFCFIYYAFKINELLSNNNHYLALLPKYNTSLVFIFNKNGDIVFGNQEENAIYKKTKKLQDIGRFDPRKLLEADKNINATYEFNSKQYKIEIIPVKKENLLLTYFTDITEVIQLNHEIEETQSEIIYAMGEIGETRSKETGNHVKRVAEYSKLLALLYGLDTKEVEKLKMASPMHDIGKVGIPDAILNAPRKLSKDEFEIMKTHAQLGYNMLKYSNKEILKAAAIVAKEHHEKFDGSGYPDGLKGDKIHIFGRITAIADVFDALGSERAYKKAWELDKILELFQKEKGKHFDPILAELFLNNLDKFLEIRDRYKDQI